MKLRAHLLLSASLFLLYCHFSLGANILFLFGGGNISHKTGIWPFVRGLGDAGHKVTFVSSNEKKLKAGSNVRDVTPLTFSLLTKEMYKLDRVKDRLEGREWDLSDPGYDNSTLQFCRATMDVYHSDAEFKSIIDSEPFDLIIVNGIFSECSLFLAYHKGVKVIIYSPTTVLPWFYGTFGAPVEGSWVPEIMVKDGIPSNIFQRMWNVYRFSVGYDRRTEFSEELRSLYRQNFEAKEPVPSLVELERNASLVLLNTHYSIDYARSLPPMFIDVGGMQCWEEIGPLPKKFEDFINGAKEGVVLITFGSTIDLSTLDSYYVNIFFEAMRKFPTYRFIWRWEGPMPVGHPENLMGAKWVPQREILNHPKTRAFMTHGGQSSIHEATFHGVPLVIMPFFSDQDFNGQRSQLHEVGVVVQIKGFSQKMLDGAFQEVLKNSKYRENMAVRSRIYRDRRMPPVEEAIFWTEFALRQDDTSALKPMLLEQPWYVRTLVDVYFVAFAIIMLFPILLLFGIRQLTKLLFI